MHFLPKQKQCTFRIIRMKWFTRIFGFFLCIMVLFMLLSFKWTQDDYSHIENNNQRLTKCIETLEKLRLINDKLNAKLDRLNEKYCYILSLIAMTY